jgi:beta-phosphoglucomutase-like phosphatase (HAD superfamily)
MAVSKNEEYLTYLVNMDQSELLPGVLEMLHYLKENQPIALGSASKMQGLFWRKRESDIILMLL